MTVICWNWLSSSAPKTSPQVQSYPPQPLLGTLSLEFGFAKCWKFVVVDCRSIASASPVAVRPRSRWLFSVVASGGSHSRRLVAAAPPLPFFSASAFIQIRSDRCLAQRLGGNKRQRVSMHDCASTRECCMVQSMHSFTYL